MTLSACNCVFALTTPLGVAVVCFCMWWTTEFVPGHVCVCTRTRTRTHLCVFQCISRGIPAEASCISQQSPMCNFKAAPCLVWAIYDTVTGRTHVFMLRFVLQNLDTHKKLLLTSPHSHYVRFFQGYHVRKFLSRGVGCKRTLGKSLWTAEAYVYPWQVSFIQPN